jgi:hypothetical protein
VFHADAAEILARGPKGRGHEPQPRRNEMTEDKALTQLVEEAVDKGATTAEEIHRSIAELPITMLEELGLFEKTTEDVKKIQDASIGAIYGVIRDINHSVAKLASDILEQASERGKG